MPHLEKTTVFNDPIYGFIRIEDPFVLQLIDHPYVQRLRRIAQMGLSSLVYPGAQHTRFAHALGAYHLMGTAVSVLRSKGTHISADEEKALGYAILLHDLGHGPFSHALERALIADFSHEQIGLSLMDSLNQNYDGKLTLAIEIFKGAYPRPFMNQLVASQLDMDRLDYLKRDSFYTGVAEGNINADRLIDMMNVVDDQLVIEQKGVYSVEKFLMARRFMYWQVYLHKKSLSAEILLLKSLERAQHLTAQGLQLDMSPQLAHFLNKRPHEIKWDVDTQRAFAALDDVDILHAIKQWQVHSDPVLSRLSQMINNRTLLKIELFDAPVAPISLETKKIKTAKAWKLDNDQASYFVFSGKVRNTPYKSEQNPIVFVDKSGKLVSFDALMEPPYFNALLHPVVRHYLCFPKL